MVLTDLQTLKCIHKDDIMWLGSILKHAIMKKSLPLHEHLNCGSPGPDEELRLRDHLHGAAHSKLPLITLEQCYNKCFGSIRKLSYIEKITFIRFFGSFQ